MTQQLKDFLQDLILNLDLRLNQITDNSQIYDNCEDALDLIAKDKHARDLYKRICEVANYETDNIEELNEVLQTYDIEIRKYKKICEENK